MQCCKESDKVEMKEFVVIIDFFIKNLTGLLARKRTHTKTKCNRDILFLLCKTAGLLELD